LEHLGRAVVVHERGRELRRADAKSDDLGRVAAAAQARQREARKARLRQVDLALQTRRRRALLLLRRLRLLLLLGLLGLLGLLRLPDLLLPDRRRALGRARRAGLRLPRGRDGGDLRRRLLALPSDADLPRPELRRLEAAAQQVVEERVDDPVEVGRKDAVLGILGQAREHLAPLLRTVRKLVGVLVEQAVQDLDPPEARLDHDLRRERDGRRRQRSSRRLV